jgi:hypothetical protein
MRTLWVLETEIACILDETMMLLKEKRLQSHFNKKLHLMGEVTDANKRFATGACELSSDWLQSLTGKVTLNVTNVSIPT